MDTRFDALEKEVLRCGREALRFQGKISRRAKDDGTVVTSEDLAITENLVSAIERLFPEGNIITEEKEVRPFSSDAPLTFVFDPIDGTDSYSQGLPFWCVGIGVLDKDRRPAGSIIYSPFLLNGDEVLLRTDPDDEAIMLSGQRFIPHQKENREIREIAIGSDAIRLCHLDRLRCRFRSYGSALTHLLLPVLSEGVDGAISPPCYVWDVAPAHALLLKAGLDMHYIDGSRFLYDDRILFGRSRYHKSLVAGTDDFRKRIISLLSQEVQ